MIIENPEAFKAWLTSVLEPLCDADPAALAKYVYALVKKDKTLDELRVGMVEQLDVFLQEETQKFVETLFEKLESKDFSQSVKVKEEVEEEQEERSGTPPPTVATSEPSSPQPAVSPKPEPTSPSTVEATNASPTLHVNGSAAPVIKRERKSESEKEEKEKERVKRPRSRSNRARSRTRSRSRSWERDRRRSRSRDHLRRDRDRSRPWRNKSPPPNLRRHDRRRSRSRSASPLRPRACEHRPRFRNRSPTPVRSRSRSLERKLRLERSALSPGAVTPTQDSNHGDVDMRLSSSSQSIQSVVAVPNSGFQPKRRCRDFDEKGYCMRGDLCPYDHGSDPVVLEDVALSQVLTYGPHGAQAGPGGMPVPPDAMQGVPQGPNDVMGEYNPDAPSLEPQVSWGRHPQSGPNMYSRGQRELISVPVAPHPNPDLGSQQQSQQSQSHQHHGGSAAHQQQHHHHHHQQQSGNPLKRKQAFDFNRLGPKQRAIHNAANCSLELKKVPRALNNITQLNNHFCKFGKIVNIQVNFGGDPEAALVTFQMPSEAKSAYRSTEAVLNNRFIKVFWHNNVNNNAAAAAIENVPPGKQGQRQSVKDRLGASVNSSNKVDDNEYIPSRRTVDDHHQASIHHSGQPLGPMMTRSGAPIATREDKVLAIKKTQEMLAAKETLKKKQEEKRKEAIKLTADLRKRKQELLDKQLMEMKSLIERAEKNPDQKDAIMLTIKTVQQSIDSLRKDLSASNNGQITAAPAKPAPKTREQAQKEILDAELDLITAQQEGQDASDLQKKLLDLRAQVATMSAAGVGRGARATRPLRGASHAFSRGRGRGATGFAHSSVDHRPTNLLVSGYETEEKAEVIAHFQQFGEIVSQIVDDATPSIVLNYQSRKEAELAMTKGRNFQDRTLSITWVSGHHLHRGGSSTSAVSPSITTSSTSQRPEQLQSITDEEIDLEIVDEVALTEEILLDEGEEEEDEDGESRSWRR